MLNFSIWPSHHKYSKKDFTYLLKLNSILGDINNDGVINVIDVVLIVNIILDQNENAEADLNNDGFINILDIVLLVNIILG